MRPTSPNAESSEKTTPPTRPNCPVCGGVLVPLRGAFRCSRCLLTLCAACEAAPVGDNS